MNRDNRICSFDYIAEQINPLLDHGLLLGLTDDDHTQYLLADGSRALAGNWSLGGFNLTSVGNLTGTDVDISAGTGNYSSTGTITSGDITIFDATPILVFQDSNSLGAASVGFIEWRDSGGGRAGFFGNSSSGTDDLVWKNEQGGDIVIQTTGAGKFQIFANVELNDNSITGVGNITGTDVDISAGTGAYSSTGTIKSGAIEITSPTNPQFKIINDATAKEMSIYVQEDGDVTFSSLSGRDYEFGSSITIDGSQNQLTLFDSSSGADTFIFSLEASGNGSITAGGGAISFGNENLTTTGTLDVGTLHIQGNSGNMALGDSTTLDALTSGTLNIAIGNGAGTQISSGTANTLIGDRTGRGIIGQSQATIIGRLAGESGTHTQSSIVGSEAGRTNSGIRNVLLGFEAGQDGNGSDNVFIGYRAGINETGGDTLIIDNEDVGDEAANRLHALIYGLFEDNASGPFLSINGDFAVGNATTGYTSKFGDGGTTDYSEFEVNGTYKMNGAATVFNDIVISLSSARVPAANAPTWAGFIGNLNAYTYGLNDFQEFSTELAHSYKDGATIEFHTHGAVNGSDVDDRTIKFEIEYTIADAQAESGFGDVYPATTTINAELTIPASTTDLTAFTIDIGDDTSGTFVQGAIVKGRIRRIASSGSEPAADPFLTEVGIHIESDTIGTRTATSK